MQPIAVRAELVNFGGGGRERREEDNLFRLNIVSFSFPSEEFVQKIKSLAYMPGGYTIMAWSTLPHDLVLITQHADLSW